jgi:hypothetical protein
VLDVLYGSNRFENAWGFRLLAILGCQNPFAQCTRNQRRIWYHKRNVGKDKKIIGQHGYGLAYKMYDVLNKTIIDACLAPAKGTEERFGFGTHQAYTFWVT